MKGRTERSVKGDMEGRGYDNFITTCDFILNSQRAKIVWRPDCALTRKGILSISLDSQRHSGRPEKKQSLTPLAAVIGVFAVWNGQRRRTDRNRKGEQEGGDKFNLKFYSLGSRHICAT